jgi:PRTRC genetic system ThiF family protein
MRIEHSLPPGFLGRRPVRVLVVGAGGTGSAILIGLPYLHQAMQVWGHPYGLHVSIMDADTVSETNCVRQPFSASDIGQNKATVLINRINMFWGTKWSAEPFFFNERTLSGSHDRGPDLLIGCVDTRAARNVIDHAVKRPMHRTTYWLDIGNNAASGQYVLGQPLNSRNRRYAARLRTVSELYPEIVDAAASEDPLPSCSAIEALDRQEPFINQTLHSPPRWRSIRSRRAPSCKRFRRSGTHCKIHLFRSQTDWFILLASYWLCAAWWTTTQLSRATWGRSTSGWPATSSPSSHGNCCFPTVSRLWASGSRGPWRRV